MRFGICIFLISFFSFARAFAAAPPLRTTGGEDLILSDMTTLTWKKYDGKIIHQVNIKGLERTRESALRWIIQTQADTPFHSDFLTRDLQVLYNTGNLYDLKGVVTPAGESAVDVEIILKDKWTLFPVVGAQGGGGSSTLGGGVFESNLLGYLVNSQFLVWTFNGATSYDLNFNQEYFYGTQTMWSLDWQDSIEPETAHFANGNSAGNFAWRRQQKEIMIGTHFAGPVRAFFYGSIFQDSVFNNDGNLNIVTPAGLQQRSTRKRFSVA